MLPIYSPNDMWKIPSVVPIITYLAPLGLSVWRREHLMSILMDDGLTDFTLHQTYGVVEDPPGISRYLEPVAM